MDPSEFKKYLKQNFDEMAPDYDEYGPVWYQLAAKLLALNPIPLNSSSVIHDNGCGTGQVTVQILKSAPAPAESGFKIHATDWSSAMIDELRKRQPPLPSNVEGSVMDSETLAFPDGFFTHSFCALVLMASADPQTIVNEIHRTLKPGGLSISSVWARYGWTPLVDAAVHAVRPNAPAFTGPPMHEERTKPEWVKGLLIHAGFEETNIKTYEHSVYVTLEEIDGARDAFCKAVGLQITALAEGQVPWSEDEKKKLSEEMQMRFHPKTADVEGFEFEAWMCVATK